MLKKYLSTAVLVVSGLVVSASGSHAQTSSPANQTSTIGDNSGGNTVVQTNPQNNNSQTTGSNNGNNSQSIIYPNIPLSPVIQNPINTENDFGLNFGGALNTYDGRNITLYLGITYQPGRTDDHNARMAKLKSETQLLESQRQATQTQLELLKKQVAEQELRLQRMRSGEQIPAK
ncbi:hypothetical protein [Chamaesiphon polymorphus]|uniref:Uncharacterized protein n=1 Tax=Chamaesiphon polymorphus CCALA 037 TaxID=2107692 RepID=A0A2T1GF44_9CYAN|nr:hypothetical protein [Chamaesiphon polymorphus]PSB56108.1 hypothetical protein C7B77_12975 [Chamaesiphon polymorphus CCALA 037]